MSDLHAQRLQGMMRVAAGSETVTAIEKVRFEHRFQNARYRPLQQPISGRGYSQRPRPDFARSLGYINPADRRCSIGACFQLCADRLNLRS
jgi:hypothetical protein